MGYKHMEIDLVIFYTKQALVKEMKFKDLLMPLWFKIDIHILFISSLKQRNQNFISLLEPKVDTLNLF